MSGAQSAAKTVVHRTLGSVVGAIDQQARFALTYDDGPEPGGSEQVLAALADAEARATFFVLVLRARAHGSLLQEMIDAGHEIALHGMDHRALTGFGPAEVRRRTLDAKSELEDITGRPVRWFRPPYGHQRVSTWLAVRSMGLEPVLWGASCLDWEDATTEQRLESAMSTAAPGVVMLAHDGYAEADVGVDDGPRPQFDRGDLTRRLVEGYAERGLTPCSVGDLLEASPPTRRLWRRG